MKNKNLILTIVGVLAVGGVGYILWQQRKKQKLQQQARKETESSLSPQAQAMCEKYKGKYIRGRLSGNVFRVDDSGCYKIHWTCATTARDWNYTVATVVEEEVLSLIPTLKCDSLKPQWGKLPVRVSATAQKYCNEYGGQFIRGTDNIVYYIPKGKCVKVHHPCVNPKWNKDETWKASKFVSQYKVDAIPNPETKCKPL